MLCKLDSEDNIGDALTQCLYVSSIQKGSMHMRKVVRGYAKDQDGNLILVGTIPVPQARTKRLQGNVRTKGIWSGKVQQSLREK
jgi:hypothetical protein